jgi:pimeloyl-ACP methyl ester carboxylesterase
VRGYGKSVCPPEISDYRLVRMVADNVGVVEALEATEAVVVGHDWGAPIAWTSALMRPDLFSALALLSVPYTPPSVEPPTKVFKALFGEDNEFYMVYFQEPGVADAELSSDPARTMRRMLAGLQPNLFSDADRAALTTNDERGFIDRLPEPAALPPWLSQKELDFYVSEFTRTGFTGGLNWYRNLDRNWHLTEHLAEARVTCPSLFVAGSLDPVLSFALPELGEAWLDDHRGSVLVEGAGHWIQQERPAEVNAALLGFLGDIVERKAHQ